MTPASSSGKIVDVVQGRVFQGTVWYEDGMVTGIEADDSAEGDALILPGLVNAHVHIESSKMSPHAFGNALVRNGILATVSDPHEIANVCGVAGMEWMRENAKRSPVVHHFGVPPCIPAAGSHLESNGALFDLPLVASLLESGDYHYLAEVMNYPGVVAGNPTLIGMVDKAVALGLPVDGHAPGLRGEGLAKYHGAGISTDHECFTFAEAEEKARLGMQILIREGSAAKNYEALAQILAHFPEQVMFCTDDSEPHELSSGQVDAHVRRALSEGFSPMAVLRAATLNPTRHYRLPIGLLQVGDPADFIVASGLEDFRVLASFRQGRKVFGEGVDALPFESPDPINRFAAEPIRAESLRIPAGPGSHRVRVIRAVPGQLVTPAEEALLQSRDGALQPEADRDLLKIVVLNRYESNAKPQVAFVSGLGIRQGAVASTVAHDSHNIVAVGVDDSQIAEAINLVIAAKGGQSLVYPGGTLVEPLEVGGLMSNRPPDAITAGFSRLENLAKTLGDNIASPFMAMSFLSLLVIPKLKLSDKVGLFDVDEFRPVTLFV